MEKRVVYGIWAFFYCLCVGLGFVPNPEGFDKAMMVTISILFFLPPFYLAWQAWKQRCRKTMLALRLISGGILACSLLLLVLNFLSVYFSAQAGLVLYVLLVMFTAPMACCQYWALSLFLWACVLMISIKKLPDQR